MILHVFAGANLEKNYAGTYRVEAEKPLITLRARKLFCCGVSRYSFAVTCCAHTAKTSLPVFLSKSNLFFRANHVVCFRPGFIFANLPRGPPGVHRKFVFEILRLSWGNTHGGFNFFCTQDTSFYHQKEKGRKK